MSTNVEFPYLGYGLGLRSEHFQYILEEQPAIDWFEIISENYIDTNGWPSHVINQLSERYPLVMHGVSMSIGSTDELDIGYLQKLKSLARGHHSLRSVHSIGERFVHSRFLYP